MLDLSYLSKYDEAKFQLREGKRLQADVDMMRRELDYFEKCSGSLIYLEGNHEDRLRRRVEATPEFEGLLTWKRLLKFDVKPQIEQPIRLEKSHLWVLHGQNYSIHFCANNAKQYMINTACGHTHRIQSFSMRGLDKEIGAWGIGCLCDKNPEYLNGRMNSWQHGFAIIDIWGKNFTFHNIHMVDNKFVWDGRLWE